MSKVKKRVFCAGDLLAILLVGVLAASLLLALWKAEQGSCAEVTVNGAVVAVLPLSEDAVYPIEAEGHCLTVRVEQGEAFVTDATCPDKVCENTGRIHTKGASVVCAAARVSVRVTGGGDADVDHVAG